MVASVLGHDCPVQVHLIGAPDQSHRLDTAIYNYFSSLVYCTEVEAYLNAILPQTDQVGGNLIANILTGTSLPSLQKPLQSAVDKVLAKLGRVKTLDPAPIIMTVHRFMGALEFIVMSNNERMSLKVVNALLQGKVLFYSFNKNFSKTVSEILSVTDQRLRILLLRLISFIAWSDKIEPVFTDLLFQYIQEITHVFRNNRDDAERLSEHAEITLSDLKVTVSNLIRQPSSKLSVIEEQIKQKLQQRYKDLVR